LRFAPNLICVIPQYIEYFIRSLDLAFQGVYQVSLHIPNLWQPIDQVPIGSQSIGSSRKTSIKTMDQSCRRILFDSERKIIGNVW